MQQKPEKADCIFVLCSLDARVAERAMELHKQGLAPYILFSGGFGALTKDLFEKWVNYYLISHPFSLRAV